MKKNRIRFATLAFILFQYVLMGATIPFLTQKVVTNEEIVHYPYGSYFGGEMGNDRARIVESNQDALTVRLEMLETAKESVILSYFDIREGLSTKDLVSSLLAAADRGVDVKIIVDGFSGIVNMRGRTLFEAVGSHENVEIRFYNTPNALKPWTLNGRMHDKYMIVDDSLLLMGGRNLYDYFLGEYPDQSRGLEREVLVYHDEEGADRGSNGTSKTGGPVTKNVIDEIREYFVKMWDLPCMKTRFKHATDGETEEELGELRTHYANLQSDVRKRKADDWRSETIPIRKATFLANPTHIGNKEPYVWHRLKEIMGNAKDGIVIQTPYAVLSEDMYQDITEITKRLPETEMVVNSLAVGDNVMAAFDYTYNKKRVLQTGIRVYEYFGKHSCHTKALLIDDDLSVIGSYNLDMRSTYVDTETMLVIHGEEFNQLMRGHIKAVKDESLLVGEDARYVPKNGVEEVALTEGRKAFNRIFSLLIQFVRYLV